MKINTIYEAVLKALASVPETQDDNFLLYYCVVYILCDREELTPISNVSFREIMINHYDYKLPSFASVIRLRRKVQANYPYLNGIGEARRREIEEEYHEAFRR